MARTVTALYDTRAEAEAAQQRLGSVAHVGKVDIIDQLSSGGSGRGLNSYHLSEEDRHAYDEGLRRGGALLCAEVDSGEDTDTIVRALEGTSSVDFEERQRGWQREGWTPYAGPSRSSASGALTQDVSSDGAGDQTGGANTVQEEHIPIVEEVLRVGKREVARGGARVRSYVREIPVQQEVTLREEHVEIERRSVEGRTLRSSGAGDDLLQERTIEMAARVEEAVVEKVATVREEVVVRKTVEEHTERVQDTVRRTEVEVENNRGRGDRSALGNSGGRSSP